MPEILTESFCERCGTKYTLGPAEELRKPAGIKRAKLLARGFKNFVLSDDAFEDALAAAELDEDRSKAAQQLDAFHQVFNFCMECRQYTCTQCWNQGEGRCLTCAPLPYGIERDPLFQLGDLTPDPTRMPAAADNGAHGPVDASAWPTTDLPAAPASAWPTVDLPAAGGADGGPPPVEIEPLGLPDWLRAQEGAPTAETAGANGSIAATPTSDIAEPVAAAEPSAATPVAPQPEAVAFEPSPEAEPETRAAEPHAPEMPSAAEPVSAEAFAAEPYAAEPFAAEPAAEQPVAEDEPLAAAQPPGEPPQTERRQQPRTGQEVSPLPGMSWDAWRQAVARAGTEPAEETRPESEPVTSASLSEGRILEPILPEAAPPMSEWPTPQDVPGEPEPELTPLAAADDTSQPDESIHAGRILDRLFGAFGRQPEEREPVAAHETVETAPEPTAAAPELIAAPPEEPMAAHAAQASLDAEAPLSAFPEPMSVEPVAEEAAPAFAAVDEEAVARERDAAAAALNERLAAISHEFAAPEPPAPPVAPAPVEPIALEPEPVAADAAVEPARAVPEPVQPVAAEPVQPTAAEAPPAPAPTVAPVPAEPLALEPEPATTAPWQIVAPEEPAAPEPVWPPRSPVYQPPPAAPAQPPMVPGVQRPTDQPVPPAAFVASQREVSAWPPAPTVGASPSVWEESSRGVIGRPGSGVQACVSCGLALSASARFCRRCGTRQG